jgi:hypothetical protein
LFEINKDGDGKIHMDELEQAMTKLLGRTPAPTEVPHFSLPPSLSPSLPPKLAHFMLHKEK